MIQQTEKINALIIRYLSNELSTKEQEELLTWLSQSEDNRIFFRSLKDAYDLGQFETHYNNSDVSAEWKKMLKQINSKVAKPVRRIRIVQIVLRYAAIFILGILCVKIADVLLEKPSNTTREYITQIETGKGERSKVILPDSSVVWLNACSSISYDQSFGEQIRNIEMKGEAFFKVHQDISKPFLVSVNNLVYRVTGTSFNIYSFDNENFVSLLLVEGSVVLEYGDYKANVQAGELVKFDKKTHELYWQQADTGFYTNWRFGELVFEKMTFEELAKRLERNFNVTFVFQNDKVKIKTFGGTFRHYDSLETILKVISTSTPIKYNIEKDTVYIR